MTGSPEKSSAHEAAASKKARRKPRLPIETATGVSQSEGVREGSSPSVVSSRVVAGEASGVRVAAQIPLRLSGDGVAVHPLPLPRIRSMGRSIFDPIWATTDHASRNIELIFILRGQVKVHTRDYVLPASEGDLIYTPHGLLHRDVFPLDSQFEVYLVHFEWEGERAMLDEVSPVMLTQAARQAPAVFAADMRQLYADFLQPGPHTAQLTSLRLLQVIVRMWHHAVASTHDRQQVADYDLARARRVQIMTDARRVIHERFGQPLGLDDIADAINVSPYYLSRVFSQEAGFTLSSYLHDVRMEKAADLLRNPRTAVGEVAHAVGFKDAHYFARVFKNHFGHAPSAYRVRMAQQTPQG